MTDVGDKNGDISLRHNLNSEIIKWCAFSRRSFLPNPVSYGPYDYREDVPHFTIIKAKVSNLVAAPICRRYASRYG